MYMYAVHGVRRGGPLLMGRRLRQKDKDEMVQARLHRLLTRADQVGRFHNNGKSFVMLGRWMLHCTSSLLLLSVVNECV